MSAVIRNPVLSTSEGVQCELGCEAFRNCKPLSEDGSLSRVDILLEQPPTCTSDSYNILTNVSSSTGSPQFVCRNDHLGLSETVMLKSMGKLQDVNKKQNVTCIYVSYLHEGFICGFCGQGHENLNAMEVHCRCHDDINPFKCHKCGQSYQTWSGVSGLKAHLSCHLPVCEQADANIPNNLTVTSVLESTDKVIISEQEQSSVRYNGLDLCELVCGGCGLQFFSPHSYEAHCKSHYDEYPFTCVECEQRFSKRVTLEEHKACHLLVKPHVCKDCGALFSFKWSLLMHSRAHGSVSNYSCGLCEKQFLLRKYLYVHQQSHLMENAELPSQSTEIIGSQEIDGQMLCERGVRDNLKVVKCHFCDAQFTGEVDFNSHMQQHRQSQLFKCEECEFVSDKFLMIQEHVNSSHEDLEVHWCVDCGGSGSVPHNERETKECEEHETSEEHTEGLVEDYSQMKKLKTSANTVEKGDGTVELSKGRGMAVTSQKKKKIKQLKRKTCEKGAVEEQSSTWQVHMELRQERFQKARKSSPLKAENVVLHPTKRRNVKQQK